MGFDALLTIFVIVAVFTGMALGRLAPAVATVGGLATLMIAGVLRPEEAFAGFANPAVVSIAGLYIVAAALRETGALDEPARRLLDGAGTLDGARRRLTAVTVALSAIHNNTPIVALFMPLAARWARRRRLSPRGLLLPLSYAAVLGGTCTLIGTSTHLVVHGLMVDHGLEGMGLLELLPIGGPVAIVGLLLLGPFSRAVLGGEDQGGPAPGHRRREYTADLRLTAAAPIVGCTVEQAGLRHLPGLFLVRIEREGHVIGPVHPEERLEAGDRLTFAGVLETIVDLQRLRGLEAVEAVDDDWVLHEAVVSPGSPLVGRSIREANFRGTYNAAVVAVHRHGEQIHAKIGDIVLQAGDTLLLQAAPGFARAFRDAPDFYLVSEVGDSARPRHGRAPVAVLLLAGLVVSVAAGLLPLPTAVVAAALLAVATGCLSPGVAQRSIDLSVLVVIGSALGLARALDETGVAARLAEGIVGAAAPLGPVGLLAAIYVTGMLLTELVSNTAAAALLFPITLAAANAAGVEPRPFLLAVSVATAISLATPLGYQTNLMVYGPGGYRVADFLRMGVPLQLIAGAVAVTALALRYDV